MYVDDATIVDDKHCQIESWVQKNRDSTEYWSLPACNFTGNLELTLGGEHITSAQGTQTMAVVQGKTLFKPLTTNSWGIGLVGGGQFNPDNNALGDAYSYVPVSFSFLDDRVLWHTNLGWLHDRGTGRDAATWGTGTELKLTDRTAFTSETYGQNHGHPFFQFGIRHQLIPDRVQVDATYGDRLASNGAERFFSIGFVLFSDAILP